MTVSAITQKSIIRSIIDKWQVAALTRVGQLALFSKTTSLKSLYHKVTSIRLASSGILTLFYAFLNIEKRKSFIVNVQLEKKNETKVILHFE